MCIPAENIEKLQNLFKSAFGVDIDAEEAQKQGLAIMRLVAISKEQGSENLKSK